uniref:Vitronectin n=1 Tax=Bos mutus grunniens TaxID=30521 RepID=A0A8C0A9K2_BOSMU
ISFPPGLYCYELDEKAVRPGYPKLIRDVWGIEGPIDAAFTRVNCQGKTYLFKGSQYWRFQDGVLSLTSRNISDGFGVFRMMWTQPWPSRSQLQRQGAGLLFKGTQKWAGGCADSGAVLGFFHA